MIINRDMLYGLPHIGCHYEGKSVNSNKLDDGAVCVCCGLPATNAHHYPPKGTAPIRHRNGYELKPALFAVCGSGAMGCHDGWHGGARYEAWWRWDRFEYEKQWQNGELLRRLGAHNPELYYYGCWVIHDKKLDIEWEYRRP